MIILNSSQLKYQQNMNINLQFRTHIIKTISPEVMQTFHIKISIKSQKLYRNTEIKPTIKINIDKEWEIQLDKISTPIPSPYNSIFEKQIQIPQQKKIPFMAIIEFSIDADGSSTSQSFTQQINHLPFFKVMSQLIKIADEVPSQMEFIITINQKQNYANLNSTEKIDQNERLNPEKETKRQSINKLPSSQNILFSHKTKKSIQTQPTIHDSDLENKTSAVRNNFNQQNSDEQEQKANTTITGEKQINYSHAEDRTEKVKLAESIISSHRNNKLKDERGFQKNLKKIDQPKINTQISQKYFERLSVLQKQVKGLRQKYENAQLNIEEKDSAIFYLQIEISSKKQKLQQYQKLIQKSDQKINQLEQKNRENTFNLMHKTLRESELSNSNSRLIKRVDKKQQFYKGQLQKMTEKYYTCEKQKQKMFFQIANLKTKAQQTQKNYYFQLKQLQKKMNEERSNYSKKIEQFQKNQKEIMKEISNLNSKNKTLLIDSQFQKALNQKISHQNNVLNKKTEEFTQTIKKITNQRNNKEKVIQNLKKQNQIIDVQIIDLKKKLQQKYEHIEIMRGKIAKIQQYARQCQDKNVQLTQIIANLQGQCKQLQQCKKDEISQKMKKTLIIEELIAENQKMEKQIQKLNTTMMQQVNQYEEECLQMRQTINHITNQKLSIKESLKETVYELNETKTKNKLLQMTHNSLKETNKGIQKQVKRLQTHYSQISQELNKIKEEKSLLQYKEDMLNSQLNGLKNQKQEKQLKFSKLLDQSQIMTRQQGNQMQILLIQIQHLKQDVKTLLEQSNHKSIQLDQKQNKIIQLQNQLIKLKFEIDQTKKYNVEYESQIKEVKSGYFEEKEECQKLREYIMDLEQHVNEIDNVLGLQFDDFQSINTDFIAEPQKETASKQAVLHGYKERKNKIIKITEQITQNQRLIDDLNAKISDQMTSSEYLKQQILQLNERIKILQRQNEQLHKNFNQNVSSINSSLSDALQQVNHLANFKELSVSKLSEKDMTVQKYTKVLKQMNSHITRFMAEKVKLTKMVQDIQVQNKFLLAKLQKLQKGQQQLKFQKHQISKQLRDKQTAIKKLKITINQITEQKKKEDTDLLLIISNSLDSVKQTSQLLKEANETVDRIQQSNIVKNYVMFPIRDLVKKLEQVRHNEQRMLKGFKRRYKPEQHKKDNLKEEDDDEEMVRQIDKKNEESKKQAQIQKMKASGKLSYIKI